MRFNERICVRPIIELQLPVFAQAFFWRKRLKQLHHEEREATTEGGFAGLNECLQIPRDECATGRHVLLCLGANRYVFVYQREFRSLISFLQHVPNDTRWIIEIRELKCVRVAVRRIELEYVADY